MQTDRRSLLKGLAAAATASVVAAPSGVTAEPRSAPADARGLLYDATKCIGCKACVVACKKASDLKADPEELRRRDLRRLGRSQRVHQNDHPALSPGDETSFVKNAVHALHRPRLRQRCMLGALQKGKYGAVSWEASRCVGCRYCQVACPFEVPQFEWTKASPRIREV
jgi:Fe-S-cluster-containing dehydrogenase component